MPPTDAPAADPVAGAGRRTLCVSIHDVAPATWPECLRLAEAIRAVADIPLTWLVVPRYHGSAERSRGMEHQLGSLLAAGHELALHGYTHLDTAPQYGGLRDLRGYLLRTVYTQGEGEFANLGADAARARIELGLAWFRERGWPVSGFVAPAWLLGRQAWPVLYEFPFEYTTTFARFHLLRGAPPLRGSLRGSLFSPTLVYAARNGAGRRLSPPLASAMAALLRPAPLVRLGLHPRDALYPALVRHAQQLVARLLEARAGATKAGFARRYAAGGTAAPGVTSSPSAAPSIRARSTDMPGN